MANSPALFFQLSSVSVLLFLASALAQTSSKGSIDVNSSLTITDNDSPTPWLSPGQDFAFGFRKVNENTDEFLLSIWYNKIPDRTIVWFGNDGNTVSRGSRVQLTADRGLVVTDPKGKQLWNSGKISDQAQVSHALFNDTGNFQLLSSDSTKLWESFSYPTDTLLPTQIMPTGGVLYSRRNKNDFSRGRFQLRLLEDGNLVLNTREILTNFAYKAYYISGTYDPSNTTNSGYQVLFDDSGYIQILRRSGDRVVLTPNPILPTSEYYHRATLGFDGVFVQYYHPKNSTATPNWSSVWKQPENICLAIPLDLGSGACGYNSLCRLDVSGQPVCQCAPDYSLVDPDDMYSNCKPNFSLGCDDNNEQSSSKDLYELLEIKNANWPTSDYERLAPISDQDCKNSCLSDCFCAAVVYGSPSCWKKKLPLSFGRQGSTETGSYVHIKVRKGERTSHSPKDSSRKKDHGTLILVGSVLFGSSVFFNFIIIGASCLGFLGIYLKNPVKAGLGNNLVENMHSFTYKELSEATKGFTEELGRGSFGIVYKGVIQMSTSKTLIAAKKLDRVTKETDNEFKTEVNAIALTHHKNLVRLVGFCEEGENRLLVYEFMVNGSLSSFVFGEVKPSWTQRRRIAFGIARGLAYLHEECNTQIIHCDIKPQNILLDEYYNARISDFGLAKLLMINQSRTKTAIRGTKGYVAPEWFKSTPITVKVDVYSFGVMLLEIICCRRNVEDLENGSEGYILIDWVWDCFVEGRLNDVVKNDEEVGLIEWEEVERFVMVGIWCIQEDPSLRPTMRKVTQMLERVVDVPQPPCPFS